MKTYAIVKTPQELRNKLVNYYRFLGERTKSQMNMLHLKRDLIRVEIQSEMYLRIAHELEHMEITETLPKDLHSTTFI